MNKKIFVKLLTFAVAAFCTVSCDSYLKEYSQDMAKVENWKDLDEVLLGDGHLESSRIYIQYYAYQMDIKKNLDILHLMSDELQENADADYTTLMGWTTGCYGFHTWQMDTGTDEDGKFQGGDDYYWDLLYQKLNCVNQVICLIDEQGAPSSTDVEGRNRVKGEAHFLRAAYYFLLVNLYGKPYTAETAKDNLGVPVKLSEFVEDKEYVRNSVQEVYDQVLADLSVAEQSLQKTTAPSIYHPDLAATYLLKSRVYLYMQNWEKAAEYAQKCMEKNSKLLDYASLNPGDNVLSKTSPETIFSMGGYAIAFSALEANSYNYPAYLISDDMMDLYSNDDIRRNLYVGKSERNNIYPVFTKMDGTSNAFGSYSDVSDCFLLRSSEAYLNLAEAAACKGDVPTAKSTLKTFLAKRMTKMPELSDNANELIQFIRDERAREFLLEGHRWFDLRRYTVSNVLPWSKEIVHTHSYYANYEVTRTEYFRLEKNDEAYTLPIPRTIYNFQNSLGQNKRPDRAPFKTDNF